MRTLRDALTEIIGYYHETNLSLDEAVAKAAPFTDFNEDDLERVLFVGMNRLAERDLKYLRSHPVTPEEQMTKRSYLGRFQLRPTKGATAEALYAHLSIRFDVGDGNRKLIDFDRDDLSYLRERYRAMEQGLTVRIEFLEWLDGEVAERRKGKVSDLPKSVLVEANRRAGRAFK